MTISNKLFLFLFFCLFSQSLIGQNLKEAGINYFISEHFIYDNSFISKDKIKVIEKHEYAYLGDTIYNHFLLEKHLFDSLGKPISIYRKQNGYSKSEIFYFYDCDANLIKKEIYGISPELHYKKIEYYEWTYNNGFIKRQRRYRMENTMSNGNGVSGFPESIFVYRNDTILYNVNDTLISIVSNNPEHCKDTSVKLYPTSFRSVINTILKFHYNNNLHLKTVKRDSLSSTYTYDKCGFPNSEHKLNLEYLKVLPNKTECLSQQEIRICENLDTLTLNNQKVYFTRNEFSYFQHDSGPGTYIASKGISYYNLDLEIQLSKDTTTSERGSMHIPDYRYVTQNIRIRTYEYFENGLLKKIITTDENAKTINVIEYKIEYYN